MSTSNAPVLDYRSAVVASMVWDDDWDTLSLVMSCSGCCAEYIANCKVKHWQSCHDRMLELYGVAVWPFDDDTLRRLQEV